MRGADAIRVRKSYTQSGTRRDMRRRYVDAKICGARVSASVDARCGERRVVMCGVPMG